jgi:hypothetical protein
VLPRLLPDAGKLAEQLVTCGLWKRAKGGYRFHDWANYQPTKEEATAARDKKSSGGALGNHRRWHTQPGKQDARCVFCQQKQPSDIRSGTDRPTDTVSETVPNPPDPSRPDPIEEQDRQPSVVGPRKRGTRIPDDFTVTTEMVTWARERVPGVDGKTETEKFVNFWRAKTGKDATKLDWPATWRNWMLNAPGHSRAVALPTRPTGGDIDWDAALARAQDRENRGAAAS